MTTNFTNFTNYFLDHRFHRLHRLYGFHFDYCGLRRRLLRTGLDVPQRSALPLATKGTQEINEIAEISASLLCAACAKGTFLYFFHFCGT